MARQNSSRRSSGSASQMPSQPGIVRLGSMLRSWRELRQRCVKKASRSAFLHRPRSLPLPEPPQQDPHQKIAARNTECMRVYPGSWNICHQSLSVILAPSCHFSAIQQEPLKNVTDYRFLPLDRIPSHNGIFAPALYLLQPLHTYSP